MKRIKLKSSILALSLILGLAGCGANTSAPSAPPIEVAPTEVVPTEVAPTEAPPTEVVSEVSTSAGAEGRSRAINTTEDATQSSEKMSTFKDEATSLSFQYPSTWKNGSSWPIPPISSFDSIFVGAVETPDTFKDKALLYIRKLNIDSGTGDAFKSEADTLAKSMFSKEQLDDLLIPTMLQEVESRGAKASVVNIKASVPMEISGNTFYRSSITLNVKMEDSIQIESTECLAGGANDQFFLFMGITENEADHASMDAIINSISFEK